MALGKKGFIYGALFGSLAGGITALLFTKKSGKELRKDIAETAGNVCTKTCDLVSYVSDQAEELVEKARCIAHEAKCAADSLSKENRKNNR